MINEESYALASEIPVLSELGDYTVTATDKVGNKTEVMFKLVAEPTAPPASSGVNEPTKQSPIAPTTSSAKPQLRVQ